MMKSTAMASRFIMLWIFCPLIALASFRVVFGGVEVMMPDFLYHAEIRPAAFYAHIFLASVALFLVPFQFWPVLRRNRIAIHRLLGRIYGVSIILSGTGGLWLAITTHSGAIAAWGFSLLAIAWVSSTLYGILLAMRQDIARHQRWMVRSAALTMAAVTLRIYLGIAALNGLSYDDIVAFLGWGCWVPNLIVAELIIRKTFGKRPTIRKSVAMPIKTVRSLP